MGASSRTGEAPSQERDKGGQVGEDPLNSSSTLFKTAWKLPTFQKLSSIN